MMRASEARLAAGARTLFVSALMLAVAAGTALVRPITIEPPPAPDLESMLPEAFGEWRATAIPDTVLPRELELKPGEAVAYRAYRDSLGRVVTLVAAYGPPLGDSVRLHRPESCYVAQGFAILSRSVTPASLDGMEAQIIRLSTTSPTREEAVSYWLRSGSEFVTSPMLAQWQAFRGLRRLDGALVRVSAAGRQSSHFEMQAEFLREFAAALGPEGRRVLLGAPAEPRS